MATLNLTFYSTPVDIYNELNAFENGKLSFEEIKEFFTSLYRTGRINTLPKHIKEYGQYLKNAKLINNE